MLLDKAASVTVYEDCACSVCADPKSRWFQCPRIGDRFVARYACFPYYAADVEHLCNGVDDKIGAETPHPEHLAQVERDHPGCVYVYMDASDKAKFRAQVDAARARLAVKEVQDV